MAIYAGCPIYAAESIFSELSAQMANNNTKTVEEKSMKELNNSELAQLLQKCLDNEDYERAAKIRDELNYRKN
jgi:protein-arginine kinase activator protein McsA